MDDLVLGRAIDYTRRSVWKFPNRIGSSYMDRQGRYAEGLVFFERLKYLYKPSHHERILERLSHRTIDPILSAYAAASLSQVYLGQVLEAARTASSRCVSVGLGWSVSSPGLYPFTLSWSDSSHHTPLLVDNRAVRVFASSSLTRTHAVHPMPTWVSCTGCSDSTTTC